MGVQHPPWILLLTLVSTVAGKFPHIPLNVNCSDLHQENATHVQSDSTNEYGENFCISAVLNSWVEAFDTWKFATEQDLLSIKEQTTISVNDALDDDEVNISGEQRIGREKLSSAEEEGVGEEEEIDESLSPEKSSFPVKIRVKGHRHWGFLHPDRDYEVIVKSVAAHPISFLLALNTKENLSSCGVGGLQKTELDILAVQNDTSSENQGEEITDSSKNGSWVSTGSNFYWAYGEIQENDTVSLLYIPPECGCLIISGFIRFPSSNSSLIIRPEAAPNQLSKLMCVDSYSVPLKDEENAGSVTEKLENENESISDNDKLSYWDSEPRQSNRASCDMDILGEVMKRPHRRPRKFKEHVMKRMRFRQKQRKKLRQKIRKEARKYPGRRRSHRKRSRHHRRHRKGRRRHHEHEDTDKDDTAFANQTDGTSSIEKEVTTTDTSVEEESNITNEYAVARDSHGKDEEEDEETAALLSSIIEMGRETKELNEEVETAMDETHKKRRKHKKRRDKKQRRKEKQKNKINALAKKTMGPGVKMCCQQGVRLKKHCFHERNATGNYSDSTLCKQFPEEVGIWSMYAFHTPEDVCIFHYRRCCEHFSLQWGKNWKERRQERKGKRKKWRKNKQEKIREIWKKQKQKWKESINTTEVED